MDGPAAPGEEAGFRTSKIVDRGGQLFELVVEGTIEVIPGPQSQIRAICNQALEDARSSPTAPTWALRILSILDEEA